MRATQRTASRAGLLRVGSRSRRVAAKAAADDLTTLQTAALVAGGIFNPIVLYSEWTLFSTGKGLDPGPGGLYGALEGIGFLVVPGIVIYSLVTKARTGGGLPAGPSGALGGVEGFSWLTTFLGIAVFANEFFSKGGLPGITG